MRPRATPPAKRRPREQPRLELDLPRADGHQPKGNEDDAEDDAPRGVAVIDFYV
jgi:hypothetical protein